MTGLSPGGRAAVDSVDKDGGEGQKPGASHLDLPGSLDRHVGHRFQSEFRYAEANQALDQKAPAQQGQQNGYAGPDVVKPDDESGRAQMQKPVGEGASGSELPQANEVVDPGYGLRGATDRSRPRK